MSYISVYTLPGRTIKPFFLISVLSVLMIQYALLSETSKASLISVSEIKVFVKLLISNLLHCYSLFSQCIWDEIKLITKLGGNFFLKLQKIENNDRNEIYSLRISELFFYRFDTFCKHFAIKLNLF